ncbi:MULTISPECIES: hypothetical protein [Oceanobacillus]|uniref:Peptidyl-prolyl cis-trans isomerase n=1 Tax=Oceanobacillus kimchii TaxID=746691 RepID=A0ABQ5TJV7_9BACI|nr:MULTISPECIES: hypothetical protein [Oceanobacillus]MBT2598835.1 hypothetical protein [Oceanobacillus sp. ISL-74]MBT2651754.1 hypothetical protein [Oceanobacillus sp. ISL-73]MCT1576403.1 hypothetical protein [Oceanobacillus kimchii]MCT2136039.1 hypothetical protein [Oceanobacillus kimchii]OEH54539.1 hypothetical protein AQ616_12330 [Oceanobacillus sp. E9]
MIVLIKGNVQYPITLDPTVWIFDDRKIKLEEAFESKADKQDDYTGFQKPPVNRSISKMEGEEFLKNSYVMPLKDFINNAEPNHEAATAKLITGIEDSFETITYKNLINGYFLFSKNGKPLKEDGPVHFYYGDGSNQDNPVKYIKEIVID